MLHVVASFCCVPCLSVSRCPLIPSLQPVLRHACNAMPILTIEEGHRTWAHWGFLGYHISTKQQDNDPKHITHAALRISPTPNTRKRMSAASKGYTCADASSPEMLRPPSKGGTVH